MQVDTGLLRTAMSHQRGNNGEIDAAIHQVRRETVPQCAGRDAGSQTSARRSYGHDLAYVVNSQPPFTSAGSKQRPAFSVLQQISEQLCVECFRDRNRAWSIAFRL